jgi:hypothetical protein
MTDINLNPQLTARLRAVQTHWGHDNISETTALILDAVINKWDIPVPNSPHIVVDKPTRIRLRVRHTAYFTQMSQMSGLGVPELARSVLIQWVCLPQNTLLLPENRQSSPENRHLLPKPTYNQPESTRKRNNKPSSAPKQKTATRGETQTPPQDIQPSPQNIEVSPEKTQPSSKTTGRSALSGLLSKK